MLHGFPRSTNVDISEQFDQFDAQESRRLREVKMFAHPDLPDHAAIGELTFDEFRVFVWVEADWDSLACSRSVPASFLDEHSVALPTTFWEPVLGWELTNAWLMKNDRDYLDAIQLRFREHASEGPYRIVQLWAVASSLKLLNLQLTEAAIPLS